MIRTITTNLQVSNIIVKLKDHFKSNLENCHQAENHEILQNSKKRVKDMEFPIDIETIIKLIRGF